MWPNSHADFWPTFSCPLTHGSVYVFENPKRKGPYINYDVRFVMERLCRKAEVKPFGFHAIRHCIATRVAEDPGISLHEVQGFLRHKRKTTTEIYLKSLQVNWSRIAKVMDEL